MYVHEFSFDGKNWFQFTHGPLPAVFTRTRIAGWPGVVTYYAQPAIPETEPGLLSGAGQYDMAQYRRT